jgi:regulator of protease activity HflC (stomatin/prohibitin superfamily)
MISVDSLLMLVGLIAVIFFIGSFARILREYERGVIFRLGKLLGTKGPGLIFLIPIVDRMVRMDLPGRDHRRRTPGSHDTGQRADDR